MSSDRRQEKKWIYLAVATFLVASTVLVRASNNCLTFSNSFSETPGLIHLVENLKIAFAEADICVSFVEYPLKRETIELRYGRIDGVTARVPAYKELVGDAAYMIPQPLGEEAGYIVSLDRTITSLETLGDQPVGYRLGAKWAINLLEGRTNILNPGTHQDLVALLQRRRVAAILMNGYTLEVLNQNWITPRSHHL